MYLTLEQYEEMGGTAGMEDAVFERMEAKARAHINRLTFGRLIDTKSVPDAVQYCMYDLITAIIADESTGGIAAGREVASMNNDGVSITFAGTSGGARSVSARYAGIVRTWLAGETDASGIPLMYPGVCVT